MVELYKITEHQKFTDDKLNALKELNLEFPEPLEFEQDNKPNIPIKYVGLTPYYRAGYFIGVDWLVENHSAISVAPKIEGIDYLRMFMHCFNRSELIGDISNIYKIQIDKPHIKLESNTFELTPFLIVHFLQILKLLVKKGLKKDYIFIEENLNSKFKGKLLLNQHIKRNLFNDRLDRNYCRYQEYSIDCVENQLLKKTLGFVNIYLKKYLPNENGLFSIFSTCWSALEKVTDNIETHKFKQIKVNPLYKEYAEALRLAKLILNRFAYSVENVKTFKENKVPPFYIDMSLLFECYVYCKLKEVYGNRIKYQARGKYGNADFIIRDEKLIIDTKYKLIYNLDRYDINNIRQLSGYARDINILKKLEVDIENPEVVPCLFIYPNVNSPENFTCRSLKEQEVNQFAKFYKIGIRLPVKPSNNFPK